MDDQERRDRRIKRPTAAAILERLRVLKEQAVVHQQYDGAAWTALVEDMRELFINDETRALYEEVLEIMPSASSVWVKYLDMELGPVGSMEAAKQLFGRCLMSCQTVPLYLLYLKFIKRMNEGRGAQGAIELQQAYEFSLGVVGQDLGSGPLWNEYLQFLQAPRPGTEAFAALYPGTLEGQEEAARTPVVRRVFQRAVLVPCNQLESLWRNYEAWEVKVDKQLGKKVCDEWRPKFQAARNVLRDRKRKLEPIVTDALPLPPGQGEMFQASQVLLWRHYIDFECSNPQMLEPESPALASRISLAYGQCLTVLWFYPELWYQYACSQLSSGGGEAAAAVLVRGQAALPGCSLLRFVHAEIRESNGKVEEAQQVYDRMLELLDKEVPSASESQPPAAADQGVGQLSPFGGDQGTLVWLQYIRFVRRTLDVASSRSAFLRARKWQQGSIALSPLQPPPDQDSKPPKPLPPKHNGGQLYAGMARLEWAADRASLPVACRVFELGLEDPRLARDVAYIISYAAFLIEAGDVDNARALFERCLSEREVSGAVELWRAYAVLETQQGNLAAALQVEERMRAALAAAADSGPPAPGAPPPLDPAVASLQLAVCKHMQEGLVPCEQVQALHLRRAAALAPPPQGPAEEAGPRDAGANGHARGGFDRAPIGPRSGGGGGWDRDGDPRSDRDRDRDRDRMRDREESQEDLGPPRGEGPPRGARREEEGGGGGGPHDLIELLINQLPPPMATEGPLVPVDAVMDVVMYCDLSAGRVAAVCGDLDVGQVPTGDMGVEVPQILGMAQPRSYPEDMPPGDRFHPGPLPHEPYPYDSHEPYPYDGPPYGMMGPGPHGGPPPHDRGPPGPGPMTRKRRWDGPPDGRGPPPPYDRPPYDDGPPYDEPYRGGPPPHEDPYRQGGPPPPHWFDDRRGPPPRGRMD